MTYLADFAALETRMYAEMLRRNRVAKRLPARKRKLMYGIAKQPYTFLHDEITVHGRERTRYMPMY